MVEPDESSDGKPGLCCQILLIVAVVLFGCANNITKQIAAVPLERFAYMMGVVSAITYVVVYWTIYLVLILLGSVQEPGKQLSWIWLGGGIIFGVLLCIVVFLLAIYIVLLFFTGPASGWLGLFIALCILTWVVFCGCSGPWADRPGLRLLAVAALGDALGDVFGYICTPYVAGPVHALLAQSTTVWVALLSLCLLQKRYSFMQTLSLVAVICVAVAGILPNLSSESSEGRTTNGIFAAILGITCIFNAVAFIAKEYTFSSFTSWAEKQKCKIRVDDADGIGERASGDSDEGEDDADPEEKVMSLNIFSVNTTESLLQLPLTLLLMPLAQATGQTHGDDLHTYLIDGLQCLNGVSMDPDHSCSGAGVCLLFYIFFNICWNILVLLSVKLTGSLATFVALKAVTPTSSLLFAVINWPLLGRTPVKPVTWLVFLFLMPAIAAYTWSSRQQDARRVKDPDLATCCWPLCRSEDDTSDVCCFKEAEESEDVDEEDEPLT